MFTRKFWKVQSEASECGLACLSICSSLLGADLDMQELRRRYQSSQRGADLNALIQIGSNLDLQLRPLKCDLDELAQLKLPAILHWRFNHFVVLERLARGKAHIIDPAKGSVALTLREVSPNFTGIALEVRTAPSFRRRRQASPLNIWSLLRFKNGVGGALGHAIVYSLLLQLFVLTTPFLMQLAIDEGVLRADDDFLLILALGFGVLALFNAGAEALRGIAVQKASALLGWDMSGRVFHKMMALPLTWFHRRKLADALSRQESIEPIRQLVSNGLISSVMDGVIALSLLGLMFIYSKAMTAVALAGVALYLVTRLVFLPHSMKLGMASLQATIAERGTRIETLRAMQTIKTMGGEYAREALWANRYADLIRATLNRANLTVVTGAASTAIEGLCLVSIVYLGAKSVLAGDITIGALYAFVGYRQQLSTRLNTLVDQAISWHLTEMHSDRIADIALTPSEEGFDKDPNNSQHIKGAIELRSVHFKYAPQDAPTLTDINIRIACGEFVAITGPSGCGKSSLVKILTGLYAPSAGEVRYDGASIASWGPRVVRQATGVVMQDDELLGGSILENVTFFNDRPDALWAWDCLRMAAVDDDVRRMPMQMETLVGDMGSTLSGGQKQRILLARALYRRPKIIVLDEATANLDVAREAKIHEELKRLEVTRILITHRPETLRLADRVIMLDQGRVCYDGLPLGKLSSADGVTADASSQPVVAQISTQ